MLSENNITNQPQVRALIALMCFHASRFEARQGSDGQILLYEEQDTALWDQALITTGEAYLNQSATGQKLSKYHLEAAIAYWHTRPQDSAEKWQNILQYYNLLLQIEYSPVAALNRTFALAKAVSTEKAIQEALKLKQDNHLYYALLGQLYSTIEHPTAIEYFERAIEKAKTENDRLVLLKRLEQLRADSGA